MSNIFSNRVIVAMSGGVDSSVAALLLKRQGYEVHGLFMTNWEEDEEAYCSAAADFQDARRVCEELEIPLHRANFARQYREHVFSYFLEEYRAGRTPNPDVLCNREIKFGACADFARRLGGEWLATGHYARIQHDGQRVRLLKARDRAKDQSYFLHAIEPRVLGRVLFPLGELSKTEVRAIARENGFTNFAKKDSTGICFIGERHFQPFLERYIPAQPGSIQTPDGQIVGTHRGLMFYTLGQRQGLGIGGRSGSRSAPWYVAKKNVSDNVLIVVQGHDHPLLQKSSVAVEQIRWLAGPPADRRFRCQVKTRYRQVDQRCEVALGKSSDCRVDFTEPQRAITPGQFAVFYDGDICLGGGVILTDEEDLHFPVATPRENRRSVTSIPF